MLSIILINFKLLNSAYILRSSLGLFKILQRQLQQYLLLKQLQISLSKAIFLTNSSQKVNICFKKSLNTLCIQVVGPFNHSNHIIMSHCSNSDEEQEKGEESMQVEQMDDILEMPMVILSSSSSQLSPEQQPTKPIGTEDPFEETVITRKRQSQHERLKRLNSVKSIWNEADEKEKRELDDLRNNPPRKINSQSKKAKEQQLHKEFQAHKFLPLEALEFVKEKLDSFPTYHKCKFVVGKDNDAENYAKMRQQNRQKLARVILLARQQLKLIKEKRTQNEERICKDNYDVLQYAYRRASQIEINFFKKLYKKRTSKIGQAYFKQIKLVLREFADRNNIQFRRTIITGDYKIEQLIQATEENIICEKTRQQNEQKMKQLIRQNQKIEPKSPISIDEQYLDGPMQFIKSLDSIKSRSEFYDDKVDILQDKRKREKDELITKNKLICKKTYSEMTKWMKAMKDRTEKLKKYAIDKGLLEKLNFDLDLSL